MKKEFLKYKIEELIDDKRFISWVINGEDDKQWNNLIMQNQEFKRKVLKAREMISLLQDHYDTLGEEDVLKIWKNINKFDQSYNKKVKRLNIQKIVGWAAVILVLISLGTEGYFFVDEKKNKYEFAKTEVPAQLNEARLLLTDGEEIALNKDNSVISFNDKDEVVVINNNTIDLPEKKIEGRAKIKMNELLIPYGKMSQIELADGTKVWLNAGSRLAFPSKFEGAKREVFLEGQAYFEVEKNEIQPFIVNVADLDIEVLGTHFDISAFPDADEVETVLLEGSVSVNRTKRIGIGKEKVILEPNQKANFNKQNKTVKVVNAPDAEIYIAWTKGWLQFSKENMISVLNKLKRYYNIDIVVSQNLSSGELITGKLDLNRSKEDVFNTLQDLAGIEYKIENNKIYISKSN